MSLAQSLYGGAPDTPAVQQPAQPSAFAQTLYGRQDAPAADRTEPRDERAQAFYGGEREPTTLRDGSIHGHLASALESAIEAGHVERSEAISLGRALTREAEAAGLNGEDLDIAMRDINRQPGADAQRQRGEAVAQLREAFGDRAEQALQAGLAVLRQRAPNLAAALARSAAGNNPVIVAHVARLGEQARRR